MSFRKFAVLILLSLLGTVGKLRAQVGVYIGFSATDFSGISCLAPTGTTCANGAVYPQQGSAKPLGLLLGGYYDFKTYGPVRLGVDVRYNHESSNKAAADNVGGKNAVFSDTGLAGVRGSFKVHPNWFRPYVQASVGITKSNITEPSCITTTGATILCSGTTLNTPRTTDTFLRYEAFGGADVKVFPILDLRIIEVGVGNMNRVGSGTSGTTSSVGVKSIGAGIVFHLP